MKQNPKRISSYWKQIKEPGNSLSPYAKFFGNFTQEETIILCGEQIENSVYLRLAYVDFFSPHLKVNCFFTQGYFLFSVLVNFLHSEHLKAWETCLD